MCPETHARKIYAFFTQRSPDDFAEDDFRRFVPRYSKENFPKILALADELKKIGTRYNATPGQVALAWLLAQGEDVLPIPGTKKVKVRMRSPSPGGKSGLS